MSIAAWAVTKNNKTITTLKKSICIAVLLLCSLAGRAQNNPYVDDKIVHFGFSLGLNFMDYSPTVSGDTLYREIGDETVGEIYDVRASSILPGFSVGFITDVRLSRHLNFRFTPTLHFGIRTLNYKEIRTNNTCSVDVLSLPISIPLYLKWSAEREMNYRPYVIAGGGMTFDFGTDKERQILQRPIDFFVEVGFGCDFYFSWFKLCPQLTYSIGFMNVLVPVADRPELPKQDSFYTNVLDRLRSRQITLTFNFE